MVRANSGLSPRHRTGLAPGGFALRFGWQPFVGGKRPVERLSAREAGGVQPAWTENSACGTVRNEKARAASWRSSSGPRCGGTFSTKVL